MSADPTMLAHTMAPTMAPTMAEAARTLLATTRFATLAGVDHDGRPLLAHVPILDDGSGAPVTVLSNLAAITLRSRQDGRGGMSVGPRLVLQGDLFPVPGLQQLAMQPALIAAHPDLAGPMESLDYSWLRLIPSRVQWIAEDASSHWLIPADLANAEPDPLSGLDEHGADRRNQVVAEVSERLGDDLLLMVQGLVGRWRATWVRLTSVDRYGLVVELAEPNGNSVTRIPFPKRLDSPDDLHAAIAGLRASALETPTAQAKGVGPKRERRQPAGGPSAAELLAALESDAEPGSPVDPAGIIGPEPADEDRSTVVDADLAEPDLLLGHADTSPHETSPDGAESGPSESGPSDSGLSEPNEYDDIAWALWPGTDVEVVSGSDVAAAGLSEGVEGNGSSGTDVDGVDRPRHRDSYSLMDSLERAGREARALAAQQESDPLIGLDHELGDVNGIITRSEREESDPGISQDVEAGGEGV